MLIAKFEEVGWKTEYDFSEYPNDFLRVRLLKISRPKVNA
jgi:hypothetical protein